MTSIVTKAGIAESQRLHDAWVAKHDCLGEHNWHGGCSSQCVHQMDLGRPVSRCMKGCGFSQVNCPTCGHQTLPVAKQVETKEPAPLPPPPRPFRLLKDAPTTEVATLTVKITKGPMPLFGGGMDEDHGDYPYPEDAVSIHDAVGYKADGTVLGKHWATTMHLVTEDVLQLDYKDEGPAHLTLAIGKQMSDLITKAIAQPWDPGKPYYCSIGKEWFAMREDLLNHACRAAKPLQPEVPLP